MAKLVYVRIQSDGSRFIVDPNNPGHYQLAYDENCGCSFCELYKKYDDLQLIVSELITNQQNGQTDQR